MISYTNKLNCTHCDKRSPIFSFLTQDELKLINENRHEVVYQPGEIIFKQGTPSTHVMSFVQGLAKIHIQGKGVNDLIIRLIKPVEFIAGPELYINNKHHYSVSSITKSQVCFIENRVFKKVLNENTKFAEALLKINQEGIVSSLDKLTSLHQKQQHGKMADAILYLFQQVFNNNPFELTISKGELAELAGVSSGSAYKMLNKFNEDGIIKSNGKRIEILNFDMLRRVSERG